MERRGVSSVGLQLRVVFFHRFHRELQDMQLWFSSVLLLFSPRTTKTCSYDSVPFSSQCNNNFFLLNHILLLDRIYLESIYMLSCSHIHHSKKQAHVSITQRKKWSHIHHLSLFYLWNLKVHVPNVQYRFHLSRQSYRPINPMGSPLSLLIHLYLQFTTLSKLNKTFFCFH